MVLQRDLGPLILSIYCIFLLHRYTRIRLQRLTLVRTSTKWHHPKRASSRDCWTVCTLLKGKTPQRGPHGHVSKQQHRLAASLCAYPFRLPPATHRPQLPGTSPGLLLTALPALSLTPEKAFPSTHLALMHVHFQKRRLGVLVAQRVEGRGYP